VSVEFVTVATFNQAVEAHLARSKLESEGITCFVNEERFIQVNWLLASAFGSVKLKVLATEAERARNLLRPKPRLVIVADPQLDSPRDDGEMICPRCRSYDVYDNHLDRRVGTFLGFFRRSWRQRWICKLCGYEWKNKPGARTNGLQN
jgi:hypothetical protein